MGIVEQGLEAIKDVVAARGAPYATSLSDDTHIFHFDRNGFYEDSAILFVNRNGHHFRLIQQPAGDWLFASTWNGIFDTQDWQTKAQLRRADAAKLIQLCGIGPQGTRGPQFESLCLLPRDTTSGRRKASWRHKLIDVAFDRGTDTFHLIVPSANGQTELRQTFNGKLWESREAVKFCAEQFGDQAPTIAVKATRGPLTAEQTTVLEDNPLWGMF